jgi:hypothetical protein
LLTILSDEQAGRSRFGANPLERPEIAFPDVGCCHLPRGRGRSGFSLSAARIDPEKSTFRYPLLGAFDEITQAIGPLSYPDGGMKPRRLAAKRTHLAADKSVSAGVRGEQ